MRRVYYLALIVCAALVAHTFSARAQSSNRRAVPSSLSTGYFVVDSDDNSPAPWRPTVFFLDTNYLPTQWNRVFTGPQQNAPANHYFFDPTHLNQPSLMDTVVNCLAGPFYMGLSHHWNFYNGNYDSVYISSNGFIGFKNYAYATTGSPAPYTRPNNVNMQTNYSNAPNAIIAAMWCDLDLRHGGAGDTSKVYYRTSTSADTFFVNYYNFNLHPGGTVNKLPFPFAWSSPGAGELFCKKFQIVLSNTDSSIQINYGGFLGGVNGFPSLLAYQAFEDNASIGVVNESSTQGTGVLYGPSAPNNWLLQNNLCKGSVCDPWNQTRQWSIKFKRWHDKVAAVAVDFPTRNYEICLGSAVTPQAKFKNVDSVTNTFKARFAIRNAVTGIAVYSRVVSIVALAPGATKDTTFAPYTTNPNVISELGTFNACAIATTFDTSDVNIGDQWPFDDTICTSIYGVRRNAVPFFDPSDNYNKTSTADIPDQTQWVSIGASVVDGEFTTWDPPPPRHPSGPVGPDNYTSPVILMDNADITGNTYSSSTRGDTLVSFPLNLQGKTHANLSFDFQRAGKFVNTFFTWPWDASSMYGPEWTILNVNNGTVLRKGDSMLLEFKAPSQPGCNPAPSSWTEIAAIDGGFDFEFKKFFMTLNTQGTSTINIDGISPTTVHLPNYFTADFRFRLRLKSKYDAGTPPPTDDNDPWYIDNPTVIVPLKPEIEVMWVRVVDPYTKIPASEAISLPVYVKIANLSSNVQIAFPIRVQILDQNSNTVYWQAVVVNSLAQGNDTIIRMPNWDAQDAATQGGALEFTVNAWLDQSNISSPTSILGTYTNFYLNIENPQQSNGGVQEFAYDVSGLDPASANDWPALVGLEGAGIGFNSNSSGSFAMKFVVSTQDTFYGIRTVFGGANQGPDAIRLSLLEGGPGQCTPNDTVQEEGVQSTFRATRGPDFDQFSTYYFPKPIVLFSSGATKGVYWVGVSQLEPLNMALGTDRYRGGALIRKWDPTGVAPVLETAFDDPYGTQFSHTDNNGDISCAWAVEAPAGYNAWSPWTPSSGWWPTNNCGCPAQLPLAYLTVGGISGIYYAAGSYTPVIRAMVSQQGMLPVQFVYLNAEQEKINGKPAGATLLTWGTASEQNNSGFNVQRKITNSDDMFENIGFVPSTEHNSSTETGYGYTDQNVRPGSYTYRLIQTDLNGVEHVSNEVQVIIDAPKNFSLEQNYPNPFTAGSGSSTTFNFTVPVSAPASLIIYNELGQVVKTLFNSSLDQGSHSIRWDGTDEQGGEIVAGSYICTLISGENTSSVKVTVTK
ncbi:MAG TPA: FlgD immunoglobulin-like domain containing protein [Candidatus Kapabacteria bacterium]